MQVCLLRKPLIFRRECVIAGRGKPLNNCHTSSNDKAFRACCVKARGRSEKRGPLGASSTTIRVSEGGRMKKGLPAAVRLARRRAALAAADRSLAIERLVPSTEGRAIGERWARGELRADEAVAQLVRHHADSRRDEGK
jgi:hypothetical protein